MDFQQDLRQYVEEKLRASGVRFREKMDLRELLIRLYTYEERHIEPVAREVRMSKQLREQLPRLPEAVRESLEKMAEWMQAGVDVNGFQSRGLYGGGSRDYQYMLYGIVHLHLTAKKEDAKPVLKKNGFAKPGAYLLYVYVRSDCVCFLKVGRHPEGGATPGEAWTGKELLEILADNWPELIQGRIIKNIRLCDQDGNPVEINDEAIAGLTGGHINTIIPLGENGYVPWGFATNGESMQAVLRATQALNDAARVQRYLEEKRKTIEKDLGGMLERRGLPVSERWEFHYIFLPVLDRFVVMDVTSGAVWDSYAGKCGIFLKYGE